MGYTTLGAFLQCNVSLATSLLTSSLFTQDQLTPKTGVEGGETGDSGCKQAWGWEAGKALAELRNPALSRPVPLNPHPSESAEETAG